MVAFRHIHCRNSERELFLKQILNLRKSCNSQNMKRDLLLLNDPLFKYCMLSVFNYLTILTTSQLYSVVTKTVSLVAVPILNIQIGNN